MTESIKPTESQLSHISSALRDLAEPIADLTLDPSNVRLHPEQNIAAIVGSLKRFGQQRPIIVGADGVVAGNGTLLAAQQLGWTHIAVTRTELTGAEATAYAIADNRTAELAEWDRDALAAQIEALHGEDAVLALATGHTSDEMMALIAEAHGEVDIPVSATGKEYDESVADDVQMIECPHCGGTFPA